MLLLAAASFAMDDPWDCPAPADLPALAAVEWVDAEVVWDTAWAAAWAQVDAACVDACTDFPDCYEASCVTAAGAEVEYRYVWWDDGFGDAGESWSLTVRLPDGVADWTEIALDRSTGDPWAASWVGTLDPAWPADEAATGRYARDVGADTVEESASFLGTGCAWERSSSSGGYDPSLSDYGDLDAWRVNGVAGQIFWEYCPRIRTGGWYYGTFDGAYVGIVAPRTGLPTGTTDADGDGFYAEDIDCDDTNPAVYPCAAETACDGVDADCDGRDPCETPDTGPEDTDTGPLGPGPGDRDTDTDTETGPARDSGDPDPASPPPAEGGGCAGGGAAGVLVGLVLLGGRRRHARDRG